MTEEEIKLVNSTSRSRGAVGKNAIVPQYVNGILHERAAFFPTVLDYGAGKDALHVGLLKKEYPNNLIAGWDIGDNWNAELHISRTELVYAAPWSLVYASNVLNVQPTINALQETIDELKLLTGDNTLIVNYPPSPRKLFFDKADIFELLQKYFRFVLPKESNVIVCQS